MEKDVLISIRGLQYLMDEESGEQEPVEVMTTGSYYKKNGHHFLIYDEATEGFDMMTHNMIKFTLPVRVLQSTGRSKTFSLGIMPL